MEFLHLNNDLKGPIEQIRVNWFYRPRDIHRRGIDSRYLFATMHSEISPITSLRGKCSILHRSEIKDTEEYRKLKDSFWYDKLFDRYIMRFYDVIPTSAVVNVPPKIKRVLDEQWRFLAVEPIRAKELTSAAQSAKRCTGFCASNDSVECAVCHQTYHMNCVRPPLLKKPSRGFAWACAPCNRAQERKLEARNTPLTQEDGEEEEMLEEEEDHTAKNLNDKSKSTTSPRSGIDDTMTDPVATAEQAAHANRWPFRYLGIHCEVEDVLDFDDRIYPRASSRLGTKHQAMVASWPGRPFELVDATPIKRKYVRSGPNRKDQRLSKETMAALEADRLAKEKRPNYVVDAPVGYIKRGEDGPTEDPDTTSQLQFRIPEVGEIYELGARGDDPRDHSERLTELSNNLEERERLIDLYMEKANLLATGINVVPRTTNFMDKAVQLLYKHEFDMDLALRELKTVNKRKDLREPEFKMDELKRFEEGVGKYGTDLRSVKQLVKTQKMPDIIRFYYIWKKTDSGKRIWGNFEGRKNKKDSKKNEFSNAKLVDDVADDQDDSAYDDDKIAERKKGFQCKFCSTRRSRHWRRAPGVAPGTTIPSEPGQKAAKDKSNQLVLALCHRCAELWRRYGIQWEDMEKLAQTIGKSWKKRIDEELLRDLEASEAAAANATITSIESPPPAAQASSEPPKKKPKTAGDAIANLSNGTVTAAAKPKPTKPAPVAAAPVVVPPKPKPVPRPCAVCTTIGPQGSDQFVCKECTMTVHRSCYGINPNRSKEKWTCDPCLNDKNPQLSTLYNCVLCPIRQKDTATSDGKPNPKKRGVREDETSEPPPPADDVKRHKYDPGKGPNAREPLKRTTGNNWVHVTCAVWTPEVRFTKAKLLEPAEGIGIIPPARFDQVCKICQTKKGACISCHHCHAFFHVGCAMNEGYVVGFDITPVKVSRRDHVNTVTIGQESGVMAAVIWCSEHPPKTIVHSMNEQSTEAGANALQLFVQNYRQADLTLTGTVRKANLAIQSTKAISQPTPATATLNRRASIVTPIAPGSSIAIKEDNVSETTIEDLEMTSLHRPSCVECGVDTSPIWYPVVSDSVDGPPAIDGRFKTPEAAISHSQETIDDRMSIHDEERPSVTELNQTNGIPKTNGVSPSKDLHDGPLTNGYLKIVTQSLSTNDTALCHKCYWRKKSGETLDESFSDSAVAKALLEPMPARKPSESRHATPTPVLQHARVPSGGDLELNAYLPGARLANWPVSPAHAPSQVPIQQQIPLAPTWPTARNASAQPPSPRHVNGGYHPDPRASYAYSNIHPAPPIRESSFPSPGQFPPHPLSVSLGARRDEHQALPFQNSFSYSHSPPPHSHHSPSGPHPVLSRPPYNGHAGARSPDVGHAPILPRGSHSYPMGSPVTPNDPHRHAHTSSIRSFESSSREGSRGPSTEPNRGSVQPPNGNRSSNGASAKPSVSNLLS
jgi:hypothetical protein